MNLINVCDNFIEPFRLDIHLFKGQSKSKDFDSSNRRLTLISGEVYLTKQQTDLRLTSLNKTYMNKPARPVFVGAPPPRARQYLHLAAHLTQAPYMRGAVVSFICKTLSPRVTYFTTIVGI